VLVVEQDALGNGQYDDLNGAAERILLDDKDRPL
ncbi:MAG: cbb3-type cytochrome oxidase assembly protein CcoS, partial [Afipia sp.]|nr:cbb3-type cytochrome oxidase assembly protein CcoS [Afipia sp.]